VLLLLLLVLVLVLLVPSLEAADAEGLTCRVLVVPEVTTWRQVEVEREKEKKGRRRRDKGGGEYPARWE
jgi:hypothetical protein